LRRQQAATVLQRVWRRFVVRRQHQIAEVERQQKENAARVLQSAMRTWLWRRTLSKLRFLQHHLNPAEQLTCQLLLQNRDIQLSTLLPLVRMLNSLYQVLYSKINQKRGDMKCKTINLI
jgi:IQ calmodulin-binding motif